MQSLIYLFSHACFHVAIIMMSVQFSVLFCNYLTFYHKAFPRYDIVSSTLFFIIIISVTIYYSIQGHTIIYLNNPLLVIDPLDLVALRASVNSQGKIGLGGRSAAWGGK